mmetsp:Transcript_20294/g.81823  ORF Transcript_20294/g.81823 Transcript_20294/m.81823 type:complete len:101 (+) Transcript_20294:2010-2312(+)
MSLQETRRAFLSLTLIQVARPCCTVPPVVSEGQAQAHQHSMKSPTSTVAERTVKRRLEKETWVELLWQSVRTLLPPLIKGAGAGAGEGIGGGGKFIHAAM